MGMLMLNFLALIRYFIYLFVLVNLFEQYLISEMHTVAGAL